MTTLNIKLPDSLAKKAAELAAKDQVSLDQFVSLAVAEKMSGWLTEGYITDRAKRGNREKFLKAMAKVPHVEPEEYDKL
jgi:hypothetical protein